jgi:hypothetical protein
LADHRLALFSYPDTPIRNEWLGAKFSLISFSASSMPGPHVFAKLLLINRSSKALRTKLPSKRLPAETFQIRAKRRNFDIESKRRHDGLNQVKDRYRSAGSSPVEHLSFRPV